MAKCSGRTEFEQQFLNDRYMIIPSGAEGSFKDYLKNKNEMVMFKCEDDQYLFCLCFFCNPFPFRLLCSSLLLASRKLVGAKNISTV